MTTTTSLRAWSLRGLACLLVLAATSRSSSANTCDVLQGQLTQAIGQTRDAGIDVVTFERRLAENANNRNVARQTMDDAILTIDRRLDRLIEAIVDAKEAISHPEVAMMLPLLYVEANDVGRQRRILRQTKAEMEAVADGVETELTILKAGAEFESGASA